MDRKLLDLLVCPSTRQPLLKLTADQLDRFNGLASAGTIKDLDGQVQSAKLAEALITRDGKTIYRVDDGIPVLLPETGISTAQLDGWK